MNRYWRLAIVAFTLWFCVTAIPTFAQSPDVQTAMDGILSKMTAALSEEQLMKLDEGAIQPFISADDRRTFATQYWCFDANVPVVVSVMRDERQPTLPFWLPEAGFEKTGLKVENEEYTYEVWQRAFPAGHVGLGINGFDRHRPHYFVAVGPQRPGDKVELSRFLPANQQVFTMKIGAFIYHDWPDLLLTKVPDELKGQALLTTLRGRAREASLIGAFRKAPYPSSDTPDNVVLTWSGDPKTTQTIQWRNKTPGAIVRYREAAAASDSPWLEAKAECRILTDRLIVNDLESAHCTATLKELKPGTAYAYQIGQEGPTARFTTAPPDSESFAFFWLSDTHNNAVVNDLLAAGLTQAPKPAFCTISGDLVGTGQNRDDWDCLFRFSKEFAPRFPLMPSMGNHDNIDGMGSDLYCALFSLPPNGPAGLEPGRAYSFVYSNALFLMPDVTAPIEAQTPWLEQLLQTRTAKWTFAIFHFPPYAPDDSNPEIVQQWLPLFDKYHVDFVLTGHVHHYLRTYPMNAGKRVESPKDGTIYYITVSVPGGPEPIPRPAYAAKFDCSGTPLCVAFQVDANKVTSRAVDKSGRIIDEFTVTK